MSRKNQPPSSDAPIIGKDFAAAPALPQEEIKFVELTVNTNEGGLADAFFIPEQAQTIIHALRNDGWKFEKDSIFAVTRSERRPGPSIVVTRVYAVFSRVVPSESEVRGESPEREAGQ
jgi:hypothetical protein